MPEPARPERYHEKNHGGEFVYCWRCAKARAICRSKRTYDTREAADTAARECNERNGWNRPTVRYRCRWCLFWHLTTATKRQDVKRVEKQRRKAVRTAAGLPTEGTDG